MARVAEWQTRSTQNRVPKGVWVQVPPRVPLNSHDLGSSPKDAGTSDLVDDLGIHEIVIPMKIGIQPFALRWVGPPRLQHKRE
jgi:hypothetical protein